MTKKDKVTVNDIIGIVHTDEPTDSVDEVRKLRGRNERFIKGYCCGDVGLVDKEKEEWFVENINSISDSERNWNDVLTKLNEVAQENEDLIKILTDLAKTIESDLDNGIETYPKTLLKYLLNASKELKND